MNSIVYKARSGQFRFRLTGKNNEIVAFGESYTTKAMLLKTLKKYFNTFKVIDKTLKKKK